MGLSNVYSTSVGLARYMSSLAHSTFNMNMGQSQRTLLHALVNFEGIISRAHYCINRKHQTGVRGTNMLGLTTEDPAPLSEHARTYRQDSGSQATQSTTSNSRHEIEKLAHAIVVRGASDCRLRTRVHTHYIFISICSTNWLQCQLGRHNDTTQTQCALCACMRVYIANGERPGCRRQIIITYRFEVY